MPSRAWSLAAVILVVFAAGCTTQEDPPADTTPTGGTPPTGGTTPTSPTGGTNPPGNQPAGPQTQPVTDAGTIQGPFEKSWPINVPQVAPRALTVSFNLTGAQPGAPPTARVYLEFLSPDGAALKSATIGLGGSGNSVSWPFTSADIGAAGDYTLRAVAEPSPAPAGIPSGGVANYDLFALVEY